MKVPFSWLAEYVDLSGLTPEQIADGLMQAGLEVEEIEKTGPQFTNVVVAKVDKLDPHPNADKLRLVTVNLGNSTQQVVCGAPNVREGIHIAFAQRGASVYSKKSNEWFELGEATIRGVQSCGMVCSIDELALGENYQQAEDGIWVLDAVLSNLKLGQPIEEALGLNSDLIFHTAPTANRGDWMSILGVAREIAAIFNKKLLFTEPVLEAVKESSEFKVTLSDTSLCNYYALTQITNAKLKDSPDWMKQHLAAAGIRSINNIVDITNYVMLATGQPLHAFDQASLGKSGTIGARRAKTQEALLTLDEIERNLTEDSIVITFDDKPVALAGVMGGGNSHITESTQNVVLEVAYFPSAITRRSARSVGLRSESSARFERGVDPQGQERALALAIKLYKELCDAEVSSITICDKRPKTQTQIELPLSKLNTILGYTIPLERCEQILTSLGIIIKKDADKITATIPSYRQIDMKDDVDLIEEIIRIEGYDKLPSTLPVVDVTPKRTFREQFVAHLREQCLAYGLDELMTESLVSPNQHNSFVKPETRVTVANSHSENHTDMRQSILPNLFDAVAYNNAQGNLSFAGFELGRCYFKNDKKKSDAKNTGVDEVLHLGLCLTGSIETGKLGKPVLFDFYSLKGIIEALLSSIGMKSTLKVEACNTHPYFHPGQCAELKLGKQVVGTLGQCHPSFADDAKIKHPMFFAEINLELLIPIAEGKNRYDTFKPQALSVYPSVDRDMAFVAPTTITHSAIENCIQKLKQPLIQSIQVFDVYQGEQIEAGHRSLAYRLTLGSPEKTLTDQEIETTIKDVKTQLEKELAVQFR